MLYRTGRSIAAVALVTGLSSALAAAPALAASKEAIVHEQVTTNPLRRISPQEERILSSAAAKVVRHIAEAQSAIRNKETESAKSELQKAETLLNIIETALPTTEVKDRIWVAKQHLEYKDSEQVIPDLIPIYSSLDELVDFMPTKEAQAHLDKAKAHLQKGEKKSAKEELDATDEALVYTEIDLPFAGTRQLVGQALADVSKGDSQEAEKALQRAEDHVVFLSVGVDEPMVAAQSLIRAANQHYASGDKKVARSEIHQAISFLEAAAKSQDKVTRTEAGEVLNEAKALEGKIEGGNDLTSDLQHLWRRSRALADRSVEYITTGWAKWRSDSPLKSDLIEAKYYVSAAKIDQFVGDDVGAAKQHLKAAEEYLDEAAAQAKQYSTDAIYKDQIKDVKQAMKQLTEDQPKDAERLHYAKVGSELRRIIQSL
jgi:hypothetical protein